MNNDEDECTILPYDFLCFVRNNSARELSAFAESAMAVNRVFQQHFSMHLDVLPNHASECNSTRDSSRNGV